MLIETLSVFPQCYDSIINESIMKRAQDKGILEFRAHDLRDWTHDKHRTTDDEPYGGGQGLVMKCEPIFEACDELFAAAPTKPYTIFLSPTGETLSDALTLELAEKDHLFFASMSVPIPWRTRRSRSVIMCSRAASSLRWWSSMRSCVGSMACSATRAVLLTRASMMGCSNIRSTRVLRSIAA